MQNFAICVVPHPPLPCPRHIPTWPENHGCVTIFRAFHRSWLFLKISNDFCMMCKSFSMIRRCFSMVFKKWWSSTTCKHQLNLWFMVFNYFQWSFDTRSKNSRFHVVPRAYCFRNWGEGDGPGPSWAFPLAIKRRKHGAWALVLCPGPAAWGIIVFASWINKTIRRWALGLLLGPFPFG